MANPGSERYKDIPLKIVGSNKFGQHEFMSGEETFNMIVTDGYFSNFAGYKLKSEVSPTGSGRGIYVSNRLGKMFAVIDNGIYVFDSDLNKTLVYSMPTASSDVFISENNNVTPNGGEVAFSDSLNLYIYKNNSNSVEILTNASLRFRPGYLTFQNGRFITPDLDGNQWRLSNENQSTSGNWPFDTQHVGAIQTKPDFAVACIRFPGMGNLLYVFGKTVAEPWQDVGATLFPYQRSTSSNVDYGCLNPATIAESEDKVCWLGINEKSGPTIMYSNGRSVEHISTDGIDYKLSTLINPANSYAFMFKQYGHLFYVITFPDDRLTYAYDWNTKSFFTLTDENQSYFIAKRVAFFNGEYYFVSINDGNLYQLGGQFTNYDYGHGRVFEIPRIRICPEITLSDQSQFISGYIGFKVESGLTDQVQRVDMSLSKDNGISFSNVQSITLPGLGKRTNKVIFWNQGMSNTLTPQFRFYGFRRFLGSDGVVGICS